MRQLYELNVRVWRTERSLELGRDATLDDLGNDLLDRLVEDGFSWLYLIGVWRIGPLTRAVALQDRQQRNSKSRGDGNACWKCRADAESQQAEAVPHCRGDCGTGS